MGLPVVDRDWVVVGATPAEMENAGFRPVGKDFPVFLHPETHEEYALARTERKTGPGYHGFKFNTSIDVTLEQDLARRDLTINAIAEDRDGSLIDPFNGQKDIVSRQIRHVSSAFDEDPVRILRVARFMARLAPRGFTIADNTMTLMRNMVANGEANNLVAERIWQEVERALNASAPLAFFKTLQECNALPVVVPSLANTSKSTQDAGLQLLQSASALDAQGRFSCFCFGVFGGSDPMANAGAVETMCGELHAPSAFRDLAVLTMRHANVALNAPNEGATSLAQLLQQLDVLRKPNRFEQFLDVCSVLGNRSLSELQSAATAFTSVDAGAIASTCDVKSDIPAKLLAARAAAITQARN